MNDAQYTVLTGRHCMTARLQCFVHKISRAMTSADGLPVAYPADTEMWGLASLWEPKVMQYFSLKISQSNW